MTLPLPRNLRLAVAVVALAAGVALGLGLWARNARRSAGPSNSLSGGLACGQWAVFRTCEVLGVPVSPGAVRDLMPAGSRGHSLKDISDVLQRAGLVTRGKKETFETFLSQEGLRVVHLTSPEHFIVVVRSGPDRVYFFDFGGRRQTILRSALRDHWSGNVLYVERPPFPTPLGFSGRDVSDGQARVQFKTLFIDKGDIPLTPAPQTVQFVYPFRNVGKSDLVIKKVYTDCACLVAKKPERPIDAGGANAVTLEYSVDNRSHSFLHEAVVETNDPAHPVIALRAAGNTNALVAVSPPTIDLGSIPIGAVRRTFLFVRYTGEEDFEFRGVDATVPFLSLAAHEAVNGEIVDEVWPRSRGYARLEKGSRIIEIAASPSEESLGAVKGEIRIATNIGGFEKIMVPVVGRVVNPVAAPDILSFGEVNPGDSLRRTVTLVSLVNQPFRVVSVTPEAAGIHWIVDRVDDDGRRAQLAFSATGAAAHAQSGTTLNVTVESGGKQFDVRIAVFAMKKPRS